MSLIIRIHRVTGEVGEQVPESVSVTKMAMPETPVDNTMRPTRTWAKFPEYPLLMES